MECSPAPECIPERLLRETALELLSADDKELGPASFLYKDSCGFFAKALAPFLKKCSGRRNVNPDLIIPVGGVEDALNLVITMQLKSNHFRPGGFVFVEERTQLWACDLFLERGLCVRTVASDRNGIIINDLSMQLGALSSLQNQIGCPWNTNPPWPLFLYILPSFNNPTGICLSPGRRLELLELTSNAGLLVVSDDTFALLDYSWEIKMLQIKDRHKVYGHYPGAANPIGALGADKEHELIPLVDFAEFKNVLSVSSFSKVIAPDLAVGWIEATDRGLLDTLSGMAFEISGGSMSHFTACIIAQCLKKDHAEGEEAVAAKIMKLPDLYRHLCDVKNTYAKRYHHLTSALIRFSNALLPPGEANQIHIEGFSDYPDGHVDNVFQFSNSSSYAISHFDKNGVLTAAFERKRIFNSISYVDDIATEDANGRPRFLKTNPQWKNRTGGYFIWVRLPVWVTPRPAFQPIFPVDAPRTTAPQFNQHPNNNFFLMDQMVLGPPSLQWFIEKARTEFSLDFKLDIECTPFGPSVSCSSYSYDSIHGLPCMPVTPFGSAGLRWNYVRMCFVRYDEAALEQAAERFVALLAKIYTECVSVPYYGY